MFRHIFQLWSVGRNNIWAGKITGNAILVMLYYTVPSVAIKPDSDKVK